MTAKAKAQRFPMLISPLWRYLLLPFGVTPDRAYAEIENGELHVRFGRVFDARLPPGRDRGGERRALAVVGGDRSALFPGHRWAGRYVCEHRGAAVQGAAAGAHAGAGPLLAAVPVDGGAPRPDDCSGEATRTRSQGSLAHRARTAPPQRLPPAFHSIGQGKR